MENLSSQFEKAEGSNTIKGQNKWKAVGAKQTESSSWLKATQGKTKQNHQKMKTKTFSSKSSEQQVNDSS